MPGSQDVSLPGMFKYRKKSVQLEQVSHRIVRDEDKEVTGLLYWVAPRPLQSLLTFTSEQDGEHWGLCVGLDFTTITLAPITMMNQKSIRKEARDQLDSTAFQVGADGGLDLGDGGRIGKWLFWRWSQKNWLGVGYSLSGVFSKVRNWEQQV